VTQPIKATEPVAGRRRRRVLIGVALIVLVGGVVSAVVAAVWLRGSNDTNDARSLNISCFAYRDTNRNAIYDLDDRPYAGLRVAVDGPDEDSSTRSNISGFANFPMSLGNDEHPVDRAGNYTFRATAPTGYSITSGNAGQSLVFSELEGSPVGIVAESTCEPIGVAPDLVVFGSFGGKREGATVSVTLANGDRAASLEYTADDEFVAATGEGSWIVDVVDSGAAPRSIEVGVRSVYVSAPNSARDLVQPLGTDILVDFDELTTSDTLFEIPNGLAGLDWRNWVAAHQKLYNGAGYINATTSAEYIAYNSSGHPATVSSPAPFDFVGTNLGVAWPGAEEFDVIFRGFLGEELVYEDRVEASTAGAIYVAAEYRGITSLEVSSAANWQVVVDDMAFRLP